MRQKATKVMNASSTSWDWLNLPEKSSPAKTKTFLIHSCGRPVLIAARSGERCGTTGSSSEASPAVAGTVGCSEVIVSIMGSRRDTRNPPGQGDSVATEYRCRPSAHRVGGILGAFQRLQVVAVSRSLAGSLHLKQVIERADPNGKAIYVDIGGLGVQDGERRNLRQALEDVDPTEIGDHQRPIPRLQKR